MPMVYREWQGAVATNSQAGCRSRDIGLEFILLACTEAVQLLDVQLRKSEP